MSDEDDIAWYRVTLHAAQLVRVDVDVRARDADVACIVAEQEREGILPADWHAVGEAGPLRAVGVRRVSDEEHAHGD